MMVRQCMFPPVSPHALSPLAADANASDGLELSARDPTMASERHPFGLVRRVPSSAAQQVTAACNSLPHPLRVSACRPLQDLSRSANIVTARQIYRTCRSMHVAHSPQRCLLRCCSDCTPCALAAHQRHSGDLCPHDLQIARRLRSAAARRREARFCGWLARGLWAGLHAAIIAVTLSANKGVAGRIRRDAPYAASLAGVLAANVALFLYLCAADPGYLPVTDRRLGGPKQAALGGAVSSCNRRRRRSPPINCEKADAFRGGGMDADAAVMLPVGRPPDPDPRGTHGGHHHMLAGASMLFESSFPDQVMLPAAHPHAPLTATPAPADATDQQGSACPAQPSTAGADSCPKATAALHRGHHVIELQHAASAPAEVGASSSKSWARQPQLVVFANGDAGHGAHDHIAGAPVAKPSITGGGARPAVGGDEAASLSNGHLLSGRDGEEDLEEQPLLPDPGAWPLKP